MKGLCLPAAIIVVGCLAAGCGSTAKSVAGNLPSKTASVPARASVPVTSTTSVPVTSTTSVPVTSTTSVPVTSTTTTTVTARPSAQPSTPAVVAPAPTTASSASGSNSGAGLIWLWVLLGAVVLGGLIAWITHAARRRSATAADWRSRLIDAYAKGSALHDAMSVTESLGATAVDAGTRWADISRRADDLAQTLYELREAVPGDGDRARIANTLVALQAVRSAMDAERSPGWPGPQSPQGFQSPQGPWDPQQAEVVRGRLAAFEASLRALREGDQS